ncbi:conserved hypothetical protein [Rhodococcus jostii RHA1]|uniref:Uncharacterized protein n=1 Tax=Rhodococcus jostii (strain RHA1) TaxID=101510 RepID=Q0SD09_RHOJR|nr:conserved hypothetical protein [Rhodococcus jostii RHA1]
MVVERRLPPRLSVYDLPDLLTCVRSRRGGAGRSPRHTSAGSGVRAGRFVSWEGDHEPVDKLERRLIHLIMVAAANPAGEPFRKRIVARSSIPKRLRVHPQGGPVFELVPGPAAVGRRRGAVRRHRIRGPASRSTRLSKGRSCSCRRRRNSRSCRYGRNTADLDPARFRYRAGAVRLRENIRCAACSSSGRSDDGWTMVVLHPGGLSASGFEACQHLLECGLVGPDEGV